MITVVRKNKRVATSDNHNEIEMLRQRRIDMMARELAHTIGQQRFMNAWVKIGQTQSV